MDYNSNYSHGKQVNGSSGGSYKNTYGGQKETPKKDLKKELCIAAKLDSIGYVAQSERIMKHFGLEAKSSAITATQIRNILSLTNELYNMVIYNMNEKLSDEVVSHSQYVKMKIAYAAGRDSKTKKFVETSAIMTYLSSIPKSRSRKELVLICHYMESLCAYHKYYIADNK